MLERFGMVEVTFLSIFGILLLLYITFALIKKIKSPHKGEKSTRVTIDSIFKLRTPLEFLTKERQAVANNTIIAPSVCQVTFHTEKNEVLTFSVKAETAEKWKENMKGMLTFNGEHVLDFRSD